MSDYPEFDALSQLIQSKDKNTSGVTSTGIPEFDAFNQFIQKNSENKILPNSTRVTQQMGDYNPIEPTPDHRALDTNFSARPDETVSLPQGMWKILRTYNQAPSQGSPGDYENQGYGNDLYAKNNETGDVLHFLHLGKVHVQPGQVVGGNTLVGTTGSSGNATGPNLGVEYYDSQGKLAPVLQSPYAHNFQIESTGSGGQGGGGKGYYISHGKSYATNIQGYYAQESDRVGVGRRNISSNIIQHVIESKGAAQRQRLMEEFPMLHEINQMSRKEQDAFLRASSKKKYH